LCLIFSAETQAAPPDTLITTVDTSGKITAPENASFYRRSWKQDNLWYLEEYHMNGRINRTASFLEDSLKTLHGLCVGYHSNGYASSENYYDHGLKEGKCRTYFKNGGIAANENYHLGKPYGPQVWYYVNGQQSEKRLYSADSLVSIQFFKPDGTADPAGDSTEMLPEYIGSLSSFLGANMNYPEAARDREIQGKVLVTFMINEDGSVSDVEIARTSGVKELDDEATRVVSLMGKWKPARQHNRPAESYFTLPVTFRLE
jgi:protein TonB